MRSYLFYCAVALLGIIVGCSPVQIKPAASPHQQNACLARHLEHVPTIMQVEAWQLPDELANAVDQGWRIETRHYRIYTTVSDALLLRQMAVLLESAYQSYSHPIGTTITLEDKLEIFYFATRQQWEAYTRILTGHEAPLYLQIQAGAYCLAGKCVAYHINRDADFSVIAHEGWHQFCQVAFRCRLPSWLDEGLATNYESFNFADNTVRFTPGYNGGRLMSLKQALADGSAYSLAELLQMDPGMAVTRGTPDSANTAPKAAAYYAQVYALVRFLREYNYGTYYRGLTNVLSDAASCRWPVDTTLLAEATQRERNPSRDWNRQVGLALFDAYITDNLQEFEAEYIQFCRQIVLALR